FPAPRYWEMIVEMELRVWPSTQTNMDRKEPTMPAAARDSRPSTGMFPTMAVSVMDNRGSAIPDMVAGTARALMLLKSILCSKISQVTEAIHNNGRDGGSVWENIHPPAFGSPFSDKTLGSSCFGKRCPGVPNQIPFHGNGPPQSPSAFGHALFPSDRDVRRAYGCRRCCHRE